MTRQEWETSCAAIKAQFAEIVSKASSPAELETAKVQCLGRKGALTDLLKPLKDFPLEERKVLGTMGNTLKNELTDLFEAKERQLKAGALQAELSAVSTDTTLPRYPFACGRLHPLTLATRRMTDILARMGFAWADGPNAETPYYNFDALNFPPNHPAKESHDTLFIKHPGQQQLLRTHTSSVQIRYMSKCKPPIRIMAPGRVFRNDAMDASHSPVFNQIEGFYVDKHVSLADLKATLTAFMRGLYGPSAKVRFRPSFFPFVEPGVEVDVFCVFCGGKGYCPVCKSTGWVEMLGAGIIHPNVLRAVHIDPEVWTGFAFGMGVERLAMQMFGINDIRTFYENDLRILKQF